MTYRQILKQGAKLAKKNHLENEAFKLLVLEISNLRGADFLLSMDEEIPQEIENKILDGFDKLIQELPVQHIVGYSYFYGYKMIVNGDVLIPRCETEELVGYVLSYYDDVFQGKEVVVADIGTGSGNIAIALKCEEPQMTMYATDISADALKTAKQNAINNNAEITFLQGNMLDPIIEQGIKLDILVSNPPYIPDDEYVEPLVKDNEPNVALFGGKDGMHFYEEIFKKANLVLKDKAIMGFEHSHTKKQEMIALATKYLPKAKVISIKDLSGKDRMTIVLIGVDNENN